MSYAKQEWNNGPAGGTPLSDVRLDHIENGLEKAAADADQANLSLASLTVEFFQDLVKDMLRPGANIALVYDDQGGLLTISSSGGGGGNGSVTIAGISDATAFGKALLGAADATAAGLQPAGSYVTSTSLNSAVDSRISTVSGAPSGLATLGTDGKLLPAQVPSGLGSGSGETATGTTFTPTGTIAANNVQTAVVEVAGDAAQATAKITPLDYNGTAWPSTRPAAWGTSVGELRSTKTPGAPVPPSWTIDGDIWIRHPSDVA